MIQRPSLRSTVTTLAAAAVLVGGADLASYAATGKPLVLGHANSAVGTTSLKNIGRGPALSLNSIKSSPPLVVNSSKQVRHLNASQVGGQSAAQLNPRLLRWHLGRSGTVVPNGAQHFFTAQVPAGTWTVTWSAFLQKDSNVPITDSYQCIAADKKKLLASTPDLSGYFALDGNTWDQFDSGLIADTNPTVTLTHARTMLFGCVFEGTVGTITYLTPPTLTFRKVEVTDKKGHPFHLTPRSPVGRRLHLPLAR